VELAIAIAANILLGLVLLGLFAGLGKSPIPRLEGPEEALKIFRTQFPDAAGAATVSEDGRTALIALQHGRKMGLVYRYGHRWGAKELLFEDLDSVALIGDDTIKLCLSDFGWPSAYIQIRDNEARADWLSRLTRPGTTHA
jgi:hypothetical protein